MRVRLAVVDRDGALKTPDGFRELPAPLENQAELILCLSIVRINSAQAFRLRRKLWPLRNPAPRFPQCAPTSLRR